MIDGMWCFVLCMTLVFGLLGIWHYLLGNIDMVFISKDLRVAGVVENAEPETETLRTVGRPSQFVLEVNGGFAAQHGITVGTEVEFLGID